MCLGSMEEEKKINCEELTKKALGMVKVLELGDAQV